MDSLFSSVDNGLRKALDTKRLPLQIFTINNASCAEDDFITRVERQSLRLKMERGIGIQRRTRAVKQLQFPGGAGLMKRDHFPDPAIIEFVTASVDEPVKNICLLC